MVRALTYCDLHTISRTDLMEAAGLYPEWGPVFSENLNLTCSLRDTGVSNIILVIAIIANFLFVDKNFPALLHCDQ